MTEPNFDHKNFDRTTFAPFCLENCLNTKWNDVRLFFDDWNWLERQYGAESIDGYYLNGYGIQGLVEATLIAEGITMSDGRIHFNSEADGCNVHFKDLGLALQAAGAASAMIRDVNQFRKMIAIARERGLD